MTTGYVRSHSAPPARGEQDFGKVRTLQSLGITTRTIELHQRFGSVGTVA